MPWAKSIGLSIQAHPNLEEVNVEGLKDFEAVEVLGHQERVEIEEVQDVEKGVSDKEDNVNVDG